MRKLTMAKEFRIDDLYESLTGYLDEKGLSRWVSFINLGYRSVGDGPDSPYLRARQGSEADSERLCVEVLKECFEDTWFAPEEPFVELGSGRAGNLTLMKRELEVNPIGFDLAPSHTKMAADAGFRVVRGDAQRLPFRTATIKSALCLEAMCHFSSPRLFWEEISRVLNSNGIAWISDIMTVEMWEILKNGRLPRLAVERATDISVNVLASARSGLERATSLDGNVSGSEIPMSEIQRHVVEGLEDGSAMYGVIVVKPDKSQAQYSWSNAALDAFCRSFCEFNEMAFNGQLVTVWR